MRLCSSSNPDVIFEGQESSRRWALPLLTIAVVNRQMPFMPNTAEVAPDFFDIVVTDPAGAHTSSDRRTTRSARRTTRSACTRRASCPTAARCRSASAHSATRSRRR